MAVVHRIEGPHLVDSSALQLLTMPCVSLQQCGVVCHFGSNFIGDSGAAARQVLMNELLDAMSAVVGMLPRRLPAEEEGTQPTAAQVRRALQGL